MKISIDHRHAQILQLARAHGKVRVHELASRFGLSEQTVRADLNTLYANGVLHRVHGGAIPTGAVANLGYDDRRLIADKEKEMIGRAVAALIPAKASLFINIGTTTEAVARAMPTDRELMVITNNINVANLLRMFPKMEVVIASGVVRRSDGGIVGEAAVDFIRQFRVDYAIIGVSAIDEDGALLDFDYREVKVAQAIMSNARHVILAADSTKFSRMAPVRIGQLSQVDTLVTDGCESASIRTLCEQAEVRLIETGRDLVREV